MSSQISIKVGPVVSTMAIGANITDQQVANALTRFALAIGLELPGTPQENLDTILGYLVMDIKRKARQVQNDLLVQANQAAINATLDADNNL